jgi:hypothetical protein
MAGGCKAPEGPLECSPALPPRATDLRPCRGARPAFRSLLTWRNSHIFGRAWSTSNIVLGSSPISLPSAAGNKRVISGQGRFRSCFLYCSVLSCPVWTTLWAARRMRRRRYGTQPGVSRAKRGATPGQAALPLNAESVLEQVAFPGLDARHAVGVSNGNDSNKRSPCCLRVKQTKRRRT